MFHIQEKSLTGFNLKHLALVFMVLDHIHYFFEFTGKVPIAFSWIGRLAAPLFLLCFVEGFIHTHNRMMYFLKIYLISVAMGAVQFGFYNVLSPAVRADDTEKQVEAWLKEAEISGELDMTAFPDKADYIVEENGKEVISDIRNGKPEKLEQYFSYYREYGQGVFLEGQDVYRVEKIGEKTILIHYSVGVPGE